MASFQDLQTGTYYLIQTEPVGEPELISVLMQTQKAVLLRKHIPAGDDFFKLKSDSIYQVIEELDDQLAAEFEGIYETPPAEEAEEYFEFEEEDDED